MPCKRYTLKLQRLLIAWNFTPCYNLRNMDKRTTKKYTLNEQELKNAVIAYFEILHEPIGNGKVEISAMWDNINEESFDPYAVITITKDEVIKEDLNPS